MDKSVVSACSVPGEAGAVPEPAKLQLQGQEHQGDAPLQQEIRFHLQKGAKKCTIVYSSEGVVRPFELGGETRLIDPL